MSRTLRSIAVLARTTLVEALRSRILMVTVAFAVALVAMSVAAAAVSMGERSRLIVDVGLAAVSALGSVITVALSVSSFARELERHTAYPVLARPIPRWVFVLGKYAGVAATMVIVVTLTVLATAVTVWAYGDAVPSALWTSLILAWLEMAVVAAIALLFSCYTGPVLAATFTAGTVLAGNFVRELPAVSARLLERGDVVAGFAIRVAQTVLPDVQALSVRTQAANDLPVPAAMVGWAAAYALVYSGAVLSLAMIIFERRRAV